LPGGIGLTPPPDKRRESVKSSKTTGANRYRQKDNKLTSF
jgi:hypothetical protein